MKTIAAPLLAVFTLLFSACSDSQPPKDTGADQVPTPVTNAGPATEAARAQKAGQDSTDATPKKDTVPSPNAKP